MPRKSIHCRLSAILLIALNLMLVTSSAMQAERRHVYALEFGTAKLGLFSLLALPNRTNERLAYRLADFLGVNPRRGGAPYLAHSQGSLSPILRYENNVNGGTPFEEIEILGMPFLVDPDQQAKRDLTVGVSLTSSASFSPMSGLIASGTSNVSFRKGLETGSEIIEGRFDTSLQYLRDDWLFFGLRYGQFIRSKELSNSDITHMSLDIGKVFEWGSSVNELTVSVGRQYELEVWQPRATVSLATSRDGIGYFAASLEVGESVQNKHQLLRGLSATYGNYIFGKPTKFTLTAEHEAGSRFFGIQREDTILSIRGERRISERLSLYSSIEKRNSTVSQFDDLTIGFGLSASGIRF